VRHALPPLVKKQRDPLSLAQHLIEQEKDTGPLGSPGYVAPEQYGRAQTDRRTDIYGLGATQQMLLTGKDSLEIHTHGLPSDCEIPVELHTLILRMLDPDPEQRPAFMLSVSTVLKKLQKSLKRPVQAKFSDSWLPMWWSGTGSSVVERLALVGLDAGSSPAPGVKNVFRQRLRFLRLNIALRSLGIL
jgi:serine/threonine protein kinase